MFVQRKLLFILALGASSIMQLRVPATMTSRKCERESSWQIPCDTELRHGQYNLRGQFWSSNIETSVEISYNSL